MSKRLKLTFSIALVFAINIAIILLIQWQTSASAVTYMQGSSGDVVKEIQTKLRNWGYTTSTADGVYGPRTVEAVKYFQSKNKLTVDGICGPQTLAAMGINPSVYTGGSLNSDINLLARIISAESRGEPYQGQVAVGAVVLNRVKHPSFPNTLAGVIYQKGAFTAVVDGQFDQPVAESSKRAAQDALNGFDPSGGSIYYFNPVTATSTWILSRPQIVTIGRHVFCK